eukprot:6188119-Pleurochrysis_carterae.AAC.3
MSSANKIEYEYATVCVKPTSKSQVAARSSVAPASHPHLDLCPSASPILSDSMVASDNSCTRSAMLQTVGHGSGLQHDIGHTAVGTGYKFGIAVTSNAHFDGL